MSRKRGEAEDSSRDVFDLSLIGSRNFSDRYLPPCESKPQWELPDSTRIIEDLEQCGSNLSIFLQAILGDSDSPHARQVLLASIVLKVQKLEEDWDKFESTRKAGDDARLMLIEDSVLRSAQSGDMTAMKFVLEKRRPDKYGKQATDTGGGAGGADETVARLLEAFKKAGGK